MRVLGPAPRPPPNTYTLLSAAEPITVDCDGPSVNGTAAPEAQPSKQAPTMNEPVAENALAPQALAALTRQKYWVAMSRSVPMVKLVLFTVVSTTMLVKFASRATWRWYAEAPNWNGVTERSFDGPLPLELSEREPVLLEGLMRAGGAVAASCHGNRPPIGFAVGLRFVGDSGTNRAAHDSGGRRGTFTVPGSGLTISGALGALASTSRGVLAVRAPSGGGLSAVPLTVIVKSLPVVGRAVVTVRVVR